MCNRSQIFGKLTTSSNMIRPISKKGATSLPHLRNYYFEPVALNIIRIEFRAYASKSFLFD